MTFINLTCYHKSTAIGIVSNTVDKVLDDILVSAIFVLVIFGCSVLGSGFFLVWAVWSDVACLTTGKSFHCFLLSHLGPTALGGEFHLISCGVIISSLFHVYEVDGIGPGRGVKHAI